MNINQKVTRFVLCLGAFVAICSGLSGLGFQTAIVKKNYFFGLAILLSVPSAAQSGV
jgi:hypothetical protein